MPKYGSIGSSGTRILFETPRYLGIDMGTNEYPFASFTLSNIKAGEAYWYNRSSTTRMVEDFYLCDSTGGNEIFLFRIELEAGGSSYNTGRTATISAADGKKLKNRSIFMKSVNRSGYGANTYIGLANGTNVVMEYDFDTFDITVNAGTGGTASASTSSATPGTTVTITSTPSAGYSANTPTASGISFTSLGNNQWSFTMPSSAVTVSCTYSKINYTVSTGNNPAAGGSLSSNKSTAQVGDTVTLTRSASAGYQFSSWTTTPTLTINNSLQFTMPAQNVSVTANWSKISYNITVGAGTGGTASSNKSTAQIGDTVTITCSPNTGYVSNTPTASGITFTGAGANKWTFTMPASAVTVSCTFTHVKYAVNPGVSPAGSGTLTAGSSTAYYGDSVQLTRSATAGWQFSSWATTPTGLTIGNDLKFTMPANNVWITANFTKINYSVSVASSPAAGGTVTTNKSTAQVGDTVTLTKTAATGYQFSSWSTSPSGININSSNQFTMPASNTTITANWSKIQYNVTVSPGTGGTASANKTKAGIGDTVTITCSPNTGYSSNTPTASGITFTNAGANKWTFTMPAAAVTVSCTFTHVSYTVSTGVSPAGSGSLSANKSSAYYNDSVQLTRSATAGWQFSSWTKSPSGLSIGNDLKFTMPASNVSVTAVFTKINYSVSVGSNPAAGGTVTTNKSTAQVGDTVTLTKTAASGYQFSSWSKTPSSMSINSSNQFTMPAQNVSVTAVWSKINYNVTTSVSSGTGTLSSNKSTAQIGDTVTITASPGAGWSAGTPSASGITFTNAGTNKWTFTMPAAAVAVSISFSKITYTITKAVSPSGGGTVTTGAATGQVGDQISVSQTPTTGYYFNGWTFSPSGPSVSGGKFTMPASNVTVTANYLKRSTASVNTTSITGGGSVTLTIVPDKTTYSHKYKLSFGTNMETSLTAVAAGTTSVTISVPIGWSDYIPSASSKTGGTLLVETYNGNTKIGDYTITGLTYNVPASVVPTVGTITTSIVRTIGGTTYANVGDVYVQGKCGVRVQVSGSGARSSTISKIEITISGYSDNAHKTTVNAASADWTSGLLTVSGTATITVKVTDSRSRTATSTKNISVSAYNKPSGTLTVYRVNNAGNRDPLGTYAKYELTKSYTEVGSNSLSWSITSQNSTASSPANSGNILPNSRQSFSQTQEYTISMTLTDSFETVTIQVTLPTAQFMIFVNSTGDRIAFMKATNDSLNKNGKSGTIEFSSNHQIYIGNTKLEDYIRGVINGSIT